MIFHENCLPADNSHERSYLFFKLGKMSQNLYAAAVVIGALRVKMKLDLFDITRALVGAKDDHFTNSFVQKHCALQLKL